MMTEEIHEDHVSYLFLNEVIKIKNKIIVSSLYGEWGKRKRWGVEGKTGMLKYCGLNNI